MKKFLKTLCGLFAAACFVAMIGAAGAIECGADLAEIVPGAFALVIGGGLFTGLSYLI